MLFSFFHDGIPARFLVLSSPWKDSKKVWGDWPLAGGAGNFIKFLKEELLPWVDSNYRTA
jgi:predicted alpha/beta superfamily hydrolase